MASDRVNNLEIIIVGHERRVYRDKSALRFPLRAMIERFNKHLFQAAPHFGKRNETEPYTKAGANTTKKKSCPLKNIKQFAPAIDDHDQMVK